MAAIVNDRDVLIMGTVPRYTPPTNMGMFLTPQSAIFKQAPDGLSASPNSYTFQATLLNLYGTVTFTWSAGLTFTVSGNTATLTYANFTAGSGWLTATFVSEGVTYTQTSQITKLADGTNGVGTPGAPGTKSLPVFLFQRGASAPAAPTGTSTLTWATGANSSYTATDGWSVAAPANPGTPGLTLWVVSRIVTAAGDTTSTAGISYAGLSVSPWASNGSTGPQGAGGVQSAAAEVYQWAATIPAGPVGSPTWNWGTRLFGTAPTGWTLAPGAPVVGYTLWAATVQVIDTAGATTTPFNWTSAAITARAGGGATGLDGLSYVTAYCASTTSATSTTPAATTGKASVPVVNGGGITGTWTSTVPTLATNERMWNTDGIYNPATNQVTWSIPYWSVFKVGSISAISANLGAITAGQIDLGSAGNSWHVDPAGNMWSGASTLAAAPFSVLNTGQVIMSAATIKTADGTVLFSTGTGLTAAGAAPGTVNTDLAPVVTNMIANSLPTSLGDYQAGSALAAGAWEGPTFKPGGGVYGESNSIYSPRNKGTVGVHCFNTPATGSIVDLYDHTSNATRMDVVPGDRYQFSVALSAHRCSGKLVVAWYNAAGQYMNESGGNSITYAGTYFDPATAGDLFPRSTVFLTIPADAVKVMLVARLTNTGGNDTYLFASEWYAGPAGATQTVGTRYTDFSANGLSAATATAATTATWIGVSGTGKPADNATVGAPAGTLVAGVQAALVATATTNFNTSNDRNAAAVVAPTILTDGTAVDHVIRTDGAADISFEWLWSGAEGDIDGFLIYIYQSSSSAAYTFGTTPAAETVYTVPASKRAFIQFGAAANTFTTFGVQAYRSVDKDIAASGSIKSAIVKPGLAAENPYQPSTSVAFVGNVTGTINGTAAATLIANVATAATTATAAGITGQLAVAKVSDFIPPNGITDVLFGGNLKSTNWNGDTGANGMGFLLERATGFIYCGGLKARGAVMGGAFTSYAWPSSGAGFYAGPEGFKCGTLASNRYFNADQFGDIYAPGFTVINSQVTVTDAILVRPRNGDNMVASVSGGGYYLVGTNQQFTDFYVGTYTASITNSSGNLAYSWNSTNASGFTTRVAGSGAQVVVYATGKLFQGQELDFYVNVTITDLNSGVSRPTSANSQIAANS